LELQLLEKVTACGIRGEDVIISGLSGAARTFVLKELFKNMPNRLLCIMAGEEKAYDLARELKAHYGKERVNLFLERDLVFAKENSALTEMERLEVLQDLLLHPRRKGIIITTAGALLYCIMSPSQMRESLLNLEVGSEIPTSQLITRLIKFGYTRVDTVTRPAQLAWRGGMLDIFPAGAKAPFRAEFFGETLDTLRRFNVDTQLTTGQETQLLIGPADELPGEGLSNSLLDYLPDNTRIFFDEPRDFYHSLERLSHRYQDFIKALRREDEQRPRLNLLGRADLIKAMERYPVVYHSFFPNNAMQVNTSLYEHISQQEMESFQHRYEVFFKRLQEWQTSGYTIRISIKSEAQRQKLEQELSDNHLAGIQMVQEPYQQGFVSRTFKLVLVAEPDLWGAPKYRPAKKRSRQEERVLVEDLQRGDYVVHELYGIGIYRGVTQVETDGVTREYILLQYSGTDKLYLPVDKLDLLHRYASSEDREPRLSKLGGTEWERTRQRVAQSIQEMAHELLQLYAARSIAPGHAFPPDTPWQAQFEDEFPYQETPDQQKAIIDVKHDMENSRPMDRLVCGDVGYGKTEVALRAAFKTVMDNMQVAILVPTTVLAEQHSETFKKRFAGFPANIEVLSRFRSPANQKKIIAGLEKGLVDIVIATHRLLSKDVKFKNLGLLVVDEEHRFGVAQKEKIKALKAQVDVLSLSATPIPRSLHMGLTGLRDLSVIETPPPERYPITTYVMEYNEELIREAVLAEVERGGQVFFVHNRIQDIYRIQENLARLLPEIRIGVGHGRMKEDELARTMMAFLNQEFQLFLCTTIIESGLDMPNVNTIIIDMADRLGLAQLYQLRGRVGRSSRVAYAYLTYHPDKVINEASQKRLNAIREFNELGAGIKIALRDLEIRGAGNILGAEQHGYIHAVGFDLYCRLLEQETAKLKGQPIKERLQPQLDIDVDYYIPDDYIPDPGTKMRIYRQLLLATEAADIAEIKREIEDRFGRLPAPVDNFLQVAELRLKAQAKEIKGMRRKGRDLEIQLVNPLPNSYTPPAYVSIKKLNPHTLLLHLDRQVSLAELQEVLDIIQ